MRYFEEPVLYSVSENYFKIPICKDIGLYDICVTSISDPITRFNLSDSAIRDELKRFSFKYRLMATAGTLYLDRIKHHHNFSLKITDLKTNFWDLYNTQSKNKEPKKFFKQIIDQAININDGFCFYCCVKDQEQVDHFLPEGQELSEMDDGFFPQLSVMSYNLVPSCGVCNRKKSSKVGNSVPDTFLHPYFNKFLDESFLSCSVSFISGDISFSYSAFSQDKWEYHQKIRFQKHIDFFDILNRYAIKADTAIKKYEFDHWLSYRTGGRAVLSSSLYRKKKSISKHLGLNSWEALMHRALYKNLNEYVDYLQAKYSC
ncbi:hypothetical protein [Acinetobacter junii]|uniref:hypothetical protein n=1 Tax=Acinetobacter junii TaxID=40215 RepID=UPI003A8A4D07